MKVGYLGIDQDGNKFLMDKYPLRELIKQIGRKHVSKMYRDRMNEGVKCVGYVIGQHWVEVFEVHTWRGAK
jgi:hypothetical protein